MGALTIFFAITILIYPHISSYIPIYPHISSYILIYPHISSILIYPHVSSCMCLWEERKRSPMVKQSPGQASSPEEHLCKSNSSNRLFGLFVCLLQHILSHNIYGPCLIRSCIIKHATTELHKQKSESHPRSWNPECGLNFYLCTNEGRLDSTRLVRLALFPHHLDLNTMIVMIVLLM